MFLAIFNTEDIHAVSDHYALNYHRMFSPTAHHATFALIRGILEAHPHSSPSAHIRQVMSLTEETAIDTFPARDH